MQNLFRGGPCSAQRLCVEALGEVECIFLIVFCGVVAEDHHDAAPDLEKPGAALVVSITQAEAPIHTPRRIGTFNDIEKNGFDVSFDTNSGDPYSSQGVAGNGRTLVRRPPVTWYGDSLDEHPGIFAGLVVVNGKRHLLSSRRIGNIKAVTGKRAVRVGTPVGIRDR
jgi:hypothetical protein